MFMNASKMCSIVMFSLLVYLSFLVTFLIPMLSGVAYGGDKNYVHSFGRHV